MSTPVGAGAAETPASGSLDAPLAGPAPAAGVALVVGAGPVGCLVALLLAQAGWRVVLAEASPEPAEGDADDDAPTPSSRSYNVVLSPRGLAALAAASFTPPAGAAVPWRAMGRHERGSVAERPSLSRGSLVMSRATLTAALLAAALARPGVTARFGDSGRLVGFCAASRVARFADGSALPNRLLVGADGIGSAVRRELVAGGLLTARSTPSSMGYKSCSFPPGTPHLACDLMHTWSLPGRVSAVSTPAPACAPQRFTVVMPLRCGRAAGPQPRSWAAVGGDAGAHAALLSSLMGDVFPTPGDAAAAAAALAASPAWSGGTVVCSRLAAPQAGAALVGDAAHATIASLGQGLNAGLESAAALARSLKDLGAHEEEAGSGDRLGAALAAYDASRRGDAHAMQRLGLVGLGASAWARARIGARCRLWGLLRRAAVALSPPAPPSSFHWLALPPPALSRLGDPAVPYGRVEAQAATEEALLLSCALAAAALAAAAARALARAAARPRAAA